MLALENSLDLNEWGIHSCKGWADRLSSCSGLFPYQPCRAQGIFLLFSYIGMQLTQSDFTSTVRPDFC